MKGKNFQQRLKEVRRADGRGLTSCHRELASRLTRDFPDRGSAWLALGIAFYSMALYKEALPAMRRALRLCPPDKLHFVQAHFGHLYRQKGEFRRAEAWYRKAVAAASRDATWHIFLGALLAVMGRLEEAEAVHREATRCHEGCIDEANLNLGLVLRAQQRYVEARACFRKALKLTPNYKEACRGLADMEQVLALIKRGTISRES